MVVLTLDVGTRQTVPRRVGGAGQDRLRSSPHEADSINRDIAPSPLGNGRRFRIRVIRVNLWLVFQMKWLKGLTPCKGRGIAYGNIPNSSREACSSDGSL